MRVGIALGSNIGDRMNHLRAARTELLALHSGSKSWRCSRIYETEPVDSPAGTAPFLNAAVEIEWAGTPRQLLDTLRAIEIKLGRPSRRPKNAPRTIDLDVLYFGDLRFTEADLAIPHPRMHARRFVLAPLMDITPDLQLPGFDRTIAQLFAQLPPTPTVGLFSESF
jgi:2-amino-4-hydroxy-6-hydroxymethyldihydropteridine diphosphokinase